MAAQALMVEPE